MYIKSWSAAVKMLALHARLQTVVSSRRDEGKRQFEEAQMVFKAARLGMEVTTVCERLAAADRRILQASANHRCTEVSADVLSKCFSRLMWHAACRDCLLAWHLVAQSSSIRFRVAYEMCACWSDVEWQNVESQRLCTMVKLIQAQVSEAIRTETQTCRKSSLEMLSAGSTVSLLFFPPPALKLWARLCLFTWHHFMTSRTLVGNLVTSSEFLTADRCRSQTFAMWRLRTGHCQLKRHRKEARFRAISEMDAVLLRTAICAWIALPWTARSNSLHRILRKRPSRRAITASMHIMRCLINEWHHEVIAERCMAGLQWVDPNVLTRQIEVDQAAPRVYQAVLLPAGSSVNAVQFAPPTIEPPGRREVRRMETE